jgi:F0F1-type ATP synthase membrane subunit b/b'
MNKVTVHDLSTKRAAIVSRALDAVDRAHARAAMTLHDARNRARDAAERGLDRAAAVIERARDRVKQIDTKSADLVNRAQGIVGGALERARPPAATASA